MKIDLYVTYCGNQEGIFGRPFMINHSVNIDAGTGDVTFTTGGMTINQKTKLRPQANIFTPKISGLSQNKDVKPSRPATGPSASKPKTVLKIARNVSLYDSKGIEISELEDRQWFVIATD